MPLEPAFLLSVLLLPALTLEPPQALQHDDKAECAKLLAVADEGVIAAQFVEPPFAVTETIGREESRRTFTVAMSFCRVIGTLRPAADSQIGFELWLPPRSRWNGKLEGVGSGGSLGAINVSSNDDFLPAMDAMPTGRPRRTPHT